MGKRNRLCINAKVFLSDTSNNNMEINLNIIIASISNLLTLPLLFNCIILNCVHFLISVCSPYVKPLHLIVYLHVICISSFTYPVFVNPEGFGLEGTLLRSFPQPHKLD